MMRTLLLVSALVSMAAFASEMAMKRNFRILDELNGQTFSYVGCDNDDPNAPAYCKDLYGYICSVRKMNNGLASLDRDLTNSHWRNLPANTSPSEFNRMVEATHGVSEESVFRITGVMRDEIRNTLSDAKTALKQFITSTPLIEEPSKSAMAAAVDNVNLRYGKEYVDRVVAHAKTQNPGVPEERIRYQANQMYMAACGANGLEVNAFFEGGSIVLCPGLMISMKDYNANKTEMLAALRFTLGHEIGHAIDTDSFGPVYTRMKGCYETVSGNRNIWQGEMAAEITADYWGAIALTSNYVRNTSKLNPTQPDVNARIVALSVDGFCTTPPSSGQPHPEGSFRVNQSIGKHPYVARALNCEPAGPESPYCSLMGAYSP